MTWRNRSFLNKTCTIERPSITYDVTTIRDRKVSGWSTVKSNVPLRLEPGGADVVPDEQIGRIVVERFTAYFQGGEPVRANDRLLISGTYYMVEGVQEYTEYDMHLTAFVRKMTRAQA